MLAQAVWTANQAVGTADQCTTRKLEHANVQHALRVVNSADSSSLSTPASGLFTDFLPFAAFEQVCSLPFTCPLYTQSC